MKKIHVRIFLNVSEDKPEYEAVETKLQCTKEFKQDKN